MMVDDFSTGPHTATLTPGENRTLQPGMPPSEQTCSFCGKKYPQGTKLIAGPGLLICTECVELCNEICENEDSGVTQ